MRPVERGPCPLEATGQPLCFVTYQEARPELLERLGEYCSYCERRLGASLAVEHIEPRHHASHRALDWDNFLLACVNCNRTKGAQPTSSLDVYLPDRDNTARAFQYGEGGLVSAHPELGHEQRDKARRTLKLLGLDKTPANTPPATDRRWLSRFDTWNMAQRSLGRWQRRRGDPDIRESIIDLARSQGLWSIWMAVFETEHEIQQALIDAFPGTCRSCFDTNTQPVARPGGTL
jgi:uncharacterized protein (TIGR02646 family)